MPRLNLNQFTPKDRLPVLLVVDDQPLNIRALNEVFKGDFQVLMATNGPDALKKAQQQQPDLILLDIVMPDMDGYEVCQSLRDNELTQQIPVIFVTAETEANVEERGFAVGAVDFITKPFNPAIVRARVTTHLALKFQMDMMQNMVHIDGLTGLANRRRFDEALQLSWNLCQREQKPMSLLMIDVDQFKRYNDYYGHIAGDECLRRVANTIEQTMVRAADLSCRYGGEEFCCLLPLTDAEGAMVCADKVLRAIHDLKLPHAALGDERCVSVSIGCACVYPGGKTKPQTLVKNADEALYQSKQQGRDRVTLWI